MFSFYSLLCSKIPSTWMYDGCMMRVMCPPYSLCTYSVSLPFPTETTRPAPSVFRVKRGPKRRPVQRGEGDGPVQRMNWPVGPTGLKAPCFNKQNSLPGSKGCPMDYPTLPIGFHWAPLGGSWYFTKKLQKHYWYYSSDGPQPSSNGLKNLVASSIFTIFTPCF